MQKKQTFYKKKKFQIGFDCITFLFVNSQFPIFAFMTKKSPRRIIVWLRNDLRLRDNEALHQALQDADEVLPIYCIDPRQFACTSFGFPRMSVFRANFLLQSIQDLKFRLKDLGSDLIVRSGEPEAIIYSLAKFYNVQAVYCHQETTNDEIIAEETLERNLQTLGIQMTYFWGSTLYHFDDLPYAIDDLPDGFAAFKNQLQKSIRPRRPFPKPEKVPLIPGIDSGQIPTLAQLNFPNFEPDKRAAIFFKGGETNALLRLKHYLWESHAVNAYRKTQNGLLGPDYSTKFSPWMVLGCLSPRTIFEEIKLYEGQNTQNEATQQLVSELIRRDFFRFVAMKFGNELFKMGGIKQAAAKGVNDLALFEKWAKGMTGIPFIDANMRELNATGFMSNRGRQVVASFLVNDLNINWILGAEHFESKLIDFDPPINYGNWNCVAGISRDSAPYPHFDPLTQARRYDPDGNYVKHWCPELKSLPSSLVHTPYVLNKVEQRFLKMKLGSDYPMPCVAVGEEVK